MKLPFCTQGKHLGEKRYGLPNSSPRHCREVSGQPHVLTNCAPEKEQNNILPWPRMELGFTVHNPVTIRITLSRYRNTCVRYTRLSIIRTEW